MVKIYPSPFRCIITLSEELARRSFCNSLDALRFI
jgi:hypothetical protein